MCDGENNFAGNVFFSSIKQHMVNVTGVVATIEGQSVKDSRVEWTVGHITVRVRFDPVADHTGPEEE
jgi:hypothetical protein